MNMYLRTMLSPEKFREKLFACGYTTGDALLVAVSGGLDSAVLASLLQENKIPFAIAHVNYGLRGEESDEDERFVADLAKQLDVPFYLKQCSEADFSESGENSTQAAARKIRYDFFSAVAKQNGFVFIATAHHADDSIETALLNFARGTGIAGLTGIKMRNEKIIRPLLPFTREEIRAYAETKKLSWREDSSNASDHYTRNRFRHHLLPWLMQEIPQSYNGFAASFEKMAETVALLEASLQHWEQQCVSYDAAANAKQISRNHFSLFPQPDLFLRFYLKRYGFSDAQLHSLSQLLEGESGTNLLSKTHRLIIDRESLFLLSLEEKEENIPSLQITEEYFTGNFPDAKTAALVDASAIKETIRLRTWKAGDKMIPLGMSGHRNISDILNELKLPLHEKEKAQIVVAGDEIVWVPGYRVAEKFRVKADSKKVLRIVLEVP